MRSKWKKAFIKCAKVFSECSSAERLKVGCIIVKDHKIISVGYNGTPDGWNNKCEDENNTTYPYVLHAESNCLTKLARTTGNSERASMFITHSPCYECAKLIYQSGIKKVYFEEVYRNTDGIDFLNKCRVRVAKLSLPKPD
jgi:dCMP deaminase